MLCAHGPQFEKMQADWSKQMPKLLMIHGYRNRTQEIVSTHLKALNGCLKPELAVVRDRLCGPDPPGAGT